jgi:LysM repeat protein
MVILLIVLATTLAACERDRPAPEAATATPGATVIAPAGGDASGQALPTPEPLLAASPTPGLLRPAATPASQETQAQPTTQTTQSSGAATQATSGAYTVQRGDTVGSIALKFGITTSALLAVNPGITNPDMLTVGQEIKLPSGAGAAAPAAPASSGGAAVSGGTYTVQRGDTLSSIAKRAGTTVAELQRLNNLTNPDRISVGQKLVLPGGSTAPAAPAATGAARTYTVQRGDTLGTIAVKFGITVAQLQAANSITNPDRISVGQVLRIP